MTTGYAPVVILALLMLVLPPVIAVHNPDVDALLGLGGSTVADGERAVDRLVEGFRTGFAAQGDGRRRRRAPSTVPPATPATTRPRRATTRAD